MGIKEYFDGLSVDFYAAYDTARKAKSKGLDPKEYVEILPAPDLASRVEGLIGEEGISELIRKRIRGQGRSKLAFEVAEDICRDGAFDNYERIKRIELAVKVGTAILTEGVLVAPTEGIRGVLRYRNQDGTDYIAVAYAGPIRGAGGTAAALSVALADYARKIFDIGPYKPTQEEVERCVEEIELYHTRAARLQFRSTDDDIRIILQNCPVCVDGVPTENIEVGVHANLKRLGADGREVMMPNRVRGGVGLVICEGIAQKAKKLLKETKNIGLEWNWLNNIIKVDVKKAESKRSEPSTVFLEELVAGRPVLCYPAYAGGLRLRYGRSRLTGIASKGFSPATMIIADGFIATGTQLKIEMPGKGCVAAPVDSIEGPFVVLKSGDAFRVNDAETATKIKADVAEIISLGDMLVTYGDFRKSNTQLQPSSYVEEFWAEQLHKKNGGVRVDSEELGFERAYRLSVDYDIPIHPRYLFEFQAVSPDALKGLAEAVMRGLEGQRGGLFGIESLVMVFDKEVKRTLELLTVPHRFAEGNIVVYKDYAQSLICSLGFVSGPDCVLNLDRDAFRKYEGQETLAIVNGLAPFRIMKRSTFIGARIGRPEKARERLMKPAPNVLFPIGTYASKDRNITRAYIIDSKKFRSGLEVEIARYRCAGCMRIVDTAYCHDCQRRAALERRCPNCSGTTEKERCERCKVETIAYDQRNVDLVKVVSSAMKRIGVGKMPEVLKGVRGLTNRDKVVEPLEKGIIRAMNNVYIFKDGTARFDSTDMPMTHFYPREIGLDLKKLKELGYERDYLGNELISDDQLVELRHQDIVLNKRGGEYLLRVSRCVDQMLEGLYGLDRFYNAEKKADMIGRLVITLSPHTSCGILNRIIGFTEACVGFAHPYTISARRRNCDGDEDTAMLLLDALLNFSREFLPTTVGGTMDTPLILTLNVMPEEVDDEVHALETVYRYPLEFYEKTFDYPYPSEIELELVENRLNSDRVFQDLGFTHDSSPNAIANAPKRSQYTQLKTMQEKVDAEFRLMDRIYAINKQDAARKLITSHFIPDLIGNLHSFSRQSFRCSSCNAKYRRVPLIGRCTKDGGKLLLTISRGGIEKYLDMAIDLAERYDLDLYIRQRLALVREEIDGFFIAKGDVVEGGKGQFNLSRYI